MASLRRKVLQLGSADRSAIALRAMYLKTRTNRRSHQERVIQKRDNQDKAQAQAALGQGQITQMCE